MFFHYVHSPVDNPISSVQVSSGVGQRFPQAIHSVDDAEWLWHNAFRRCGKRSLSLGDEPVGRFALPCN